MLWSWLGVEREPVARVARSVGIGLYAGSIAGFVLSMAIPFTAFAGWQRGPDEEHRDDRISLTLTNGRVGIHYVRNYRRTVTGAAKPPAVGCIREPRDLTAAALLPIPLAASDPRPGGMRSLQFAGFGWFPSRLTTGFGLVYADGFEVPLIVPMAVSGLGLFLSRRARRTVDAGAIPCPACGYDLRAAPTARCSECGNNASPLTEALTEAGAA